jgi:hypothetical protein
MTFDFPDGATNGQTYTASNGRVYRYNGITWVIDSVSTISTISEEFLSINGDGVITGSSQLTASLDTRYTLSGSVQTITLPSDLISSSAQITEFGFISSSTTIDTGSFATTSSLNTLSSSVDSRLDTLETSIISGSPNYTQVLGNKITNITTTGVSIISGSITTSGNPVQIMVTGDANPTVTGWCRLQLHRGESAIGNIIQVENESNQNVPYCLNIIDTPSSGTHTYSMRTVSGLSGTFEFGEASGPLLTAVELKTNTNLPSTNNTFTGTNTFTTTTTLRGEVSIGTGSGDEGGEIQLALSQTNTTLTGSVVVDVWRDRLRIFEGGSNNRGAFLNLVSQSNSVGSEIVTSTSVNSIQTITSASYAGITPVSGTLYIIIG